MRHHRLGPLALATAVAVALTALGAAPSVVRAQDAPRPDARPSDPPRDDHGQQHDDHADARHDDAHGDAAIQGYRHDHPGASARCHDGFFTRTTDRRLACSRHGGIDVWIAMP